MLSRLRRHAATPSRILGRAAVASMEFAIIAPVMLTLTIGVFDIAKGMIIWKEIYETSRNIPVSASSISVQADKTTSLTPAQAQESMSTIFAEMPWIRARADSSITKTVILSSVAFVPVNNCQPSAQSNCYKPYVAWSTSYAGGNGQGIIPFTAARRPCGYLTSIGPTAAIPPNQQLVVLRTLNISKPDPILVADVHYQYRPIFKRFFPSGVMDFWATGYWSVRSVDPTKAATAQYTTYVPADPAVNCAAPPASF